MGKPRGRHERERASESVHRQDLMFDEEAAAAKGLVIGGRKLYAVLPGRLSSFRNRCVVVARLILLAATSSINFSHSSTGNLAIGRSSFVSKKTRQAASAARLFSPANRWVRRI